ncbi:MAG TPA: hypothetical protein ENO20_12970 [Bacteroides sp.]|nr:hypothetical protein [Bacteroides sp.]
MKRSLEIWISCLAAVICFSGYQPLWSQGRSLAAQLEQYDQKYGNDPRLVNGEKYYYPYTRSQGDPFLEPSPRKTTLHIGGNVFEDQEIRYDIYNQLLVLEYKDVYGATSSLVLPGARVEAFSDDRRSFKKMEGPEGKERFFQVIHEGPVSCCYSWKKEYRLDATSGAGDYYFTEPVREAYLVWGHAFYNYRGNRSFNRVFDTENKKLIRQFMRRHHINVRSASESQMQSLMEYCNAITDEAQ